VKQVIVSAEAPAAIGPYSQAVAVEAQQIVFLSGQIALDAEGRLVGEGDVRAQTRQVLANLGAVLKAAHLGFEHVVKTTIYLRDMADYAAVNEEYGQVFRDRPPARAAFSVVGLPRDVLVEIECIAAR